MKPPHHLLCLPAPFGRDGTGLLPQHRFFPPMLVQWQIVCIALGAAGGVLAVVALVLFFLNWHLQRTAPKPSPTAPPVVDEEASLPRRAPPREEQQDTPHNST